MTGISLHKSYNFAVVEAGGYENTTFVKRDCQNYVEQVRQLCLGQGDTIALQACFSKNYAFNYVSNLTKMLSLSILHTK